MPTGSKTAQLTNLGSLLGTIWVMGLCHRSQI